MSFEDDMHPGMDHLQIKEMRLPSRLPTETSAHRNVYNVAVTLRNERHYYYYKVSIIK